MKEFFNKIGAWIKSTALKVWAFVKTHVAVSAIVAGVLVLGIAAGIVLPIVLNDSGSSNSSSAGGEGGGDEVTYTYRITVQTELGYGFPNLKVVLKDGDKEVASKNTNSAGNANFSLEDVKKLGEYTISIPEIPEGYVYAEDKTYKTVAVSGTQTRVNIKPNGKLLEGTPIGGAKYELGDIVHDFTVTDTEGNRHTLSELLKVKDVVVLNFWFVNCGPCKSEFPSMNNAYISYWDEENKISYSDKMEILAISTTDLQASVITYKSDMGLQFPMTGANEGAEALNRFSIPGAPTTIVIDRNGVLCYTHTGSIPSVTAFQNIFQQFIGDEYKTKILNSDQTQSGGGEGEVIEMIKPTVDNPLLEDVKKALGNDDAFTYAWDEGDDAEYSWPWLVSEDGQYVYSSNKGVDNSFSTLCAKFTANAGEAICFDYKLETESYGLSGGDYFYVFIDGVIIHQLSGLEKDWKTCVAYVFEDHEVGEHELILLYYKDGTISSGRDVVEIKDFRISNVSELNTPEIDINIIRQAATVKNDDENATTAYKNYATVVLNSEDGYYHVGHENGPLLFANIKASSNWSNYSLYDLGASGRCISDRVDLFPYIDTMAWEGDYNYTNLGYTPVTEFWKGYLQLITECTPYIDHEDNILKKFNGEWHENEWLELCVYFDHYGDTPVMEDPLIGVTYHAAIDITEGTTPVNVKFDLVPRGFKHKFVPEKTGTYHIYSTGDYDTMCFISDESPVNVPTSVLYAAEPGKYILATYTSEINYTDGNFNFYHSFEAGKVYYLQFCFFSTTGTGIYDVTIEYAPETTQVLTPCGTHITFGEHDQNFFYVQDGIDFGFNEETGTYCAKNADGTFGSTIYVDLLHPTWYTDGWWSLNDVVFNRDDIPSYQLRGFTLGEYEAELRKLCWTVSQTGELAGMAEMTQEVYELISGLTAMQEEAVQNDWLLFCYYYKPLNA